MVITPFKDRITPFKRIMSEQIILAIDRKPGPFSNSDIENEEVEYDPPFVILDKIEGDLGEGVQRSELHTRVLNALII